MIGARMSGRLVISAHYNAYAHGYEGYDLHLVGARRTHDLRALLEPFDGRHIKVTVEEVAGPASPCCGDPADCQERCPPPTGS